MIAFEVNDMTSGHCVSTITKAVRNVDEDAKVNIDLIAHRVEIEPGRVNAHELSRAISEAGYTPQSIGSTADRPAPTNSARPEGCCCR